MLNSTGFHPPVAPPPGIPAFRRAARADDRGLVVSGLTFGRQLHGLCGTSALIGEGSVHS
ncbi:hypothetical protein GCM10010430_55350 [Kitasatospora cystarginea]|uniref:Uncharacterized protein n=1 Tax=Kitasatospora cystarginea TaxID=58350 RepID=A0ABN3EN00_9ACTN